MLASWFYRNIISPEAGPIVRLAVRELRDLYGARTFEALADLHPSLRQSASVRSHEIYGNADGTGTAQSRSLACHKAISEALERWAFYDLRGRPQDHEKYGLHIDATTSGFAAWPQISASGARHRAINEAIERWALNAWWQKKLSHRFIPYPQGSALEIMTPFRDTVTVILFGKFSSHFVYGFATGRDLKDAAFRAAVELERNGRVLNMQTAVLSDSSHMHERRLQFFASVEGHELFQQRLACEEIRTTRMPELLVDCEIVGPWSKYAKVWRTLYRPVASVDAWDERVFLF